MNIYEVLRLEAKRQLWEKVRRDWWPKRGGYNPLCIMAAVKDYPLEDLQRLVEVW